ncbi:substrate-binding domain-containing protein [Streptomyces boninensis]|uniref:substrate-binding domain-containing protein n=1 Tax=Streptomyces boninensis TaxID=2039455 RepID=UPI003B21CFBF
MPARHPDSLGIALVVPLRGPAGIFGPACELCARLAADEVNAAGGVLGRELRLVPVDGGAPPREIAAEVERLVAAGAVHGVTGWHISSVRQALAPRIAGRVPYVYTALYEGGEHTEGVYLTSETPDAQLRPAIELLAREHRIRRWFVVGNDYVWPRRTARAAAGYARATGGRVTGAAFLPLGTHDFGPTLGRIERSDADAVLMLMVGSDAVRFNRAYAAAGLDARAPRLSTLMDENMLAAGGPDAHRGLFATAGFFARLAGQDAMDFHGAYAHAFGVTAPQPGSLGESCYEGVRLLAALIDRAGSLDVPVIERATGAGAVSYEGPRGHLRIAPDRHVRQRIYLARATGMDFDVVAELDQQHYFP